MKMKNKHLLMRMAGGLMAGAMLFSGMPMASLAGSWQMGSKGWWYQNDDATYPVNGWQWIDGNGDRVSECYYFDSEGWLLVSGTTPDGYTVNELGQWVSNGVVQTRGGARQADSTPDSDSGSTEETAVEEGSSGDDELQFYWKNVGDEGNSPNYVPGSIYWEYKHDFDLVPYEKSALTTVYKGLALENFKMYGETYNEGFTMSKNVYQYAYFNLGGKYDLLDFYFGHVDGSDQYNAEYYIYLDGIYAYTISMPWDAALRHYEIPLKKAKILEIRSTGTGGAKYGFTDLGWRIAGSYIW